jgi:hypothetical protein
MNLTAKAANSQFPRQEGEYVSFCRKTVGGLTIGCLAIDRLWPVNSAFPLFKEEVIRC